MKQLLKRISAILLTTFMLLGGLLTVSAEGQTTKVFVIGDSTAASYASNRYPLTGWAQVLQMYFASNITVDDRAQSGASSKSFYNSYWTSVIGSVSAGDYVVIQFGHNDSKTTTSPEDNVTVPDPDRYADPTASSDTEGSYKWYLTKFIEETRAKGAIPILTTSIERRKIENNLFQYTLTSYANSMKELGIEKNVEVIDLHSASFAFYNRLGINRTKDIFLHLAAGENANYPDGIEDNTHLQENGAIEISKLFAIELSNSNYDLKNSLLPIQYEEETSLIPNGGFEFGDPTGWGFSFKNSGSVDVAFEDCLKTSDAADGNYYLDLKGLTGSLSYTLENLKPYTRYKVSFSVKSSIADVILPYVTYYGINDAGQSVEYTAANFSSIDPESSNVIAQAYAINNNAQYKIGAAYTEETDKTTWQNVGFEIPVQSNRLDKVYIRFRALTADPYLCLDNFNITPVEGEYNYMSNGSLSLMRAKNIASVWNLGMDEDATGNKIKYLAGGTNAVKLTQAVSLTSGRYKLKFKAKMVSTGARIFVHFTSGDATVTWANYGVHTAAGSYATIGNIVGTDWTDVEYYFSIPTDSAGNVLAYSLTFMLPSTRPGVTNIIGGYYDDFMVVKDENNIEFSSYTWRTKVDYGGRSLFKTYTATSMSSAISSGKTTIPVSTLIYPKTANGVSETAYLITCIYKNVDGNKKLISVSFANGATDETNASDATSGANAYGILSLTNNVAIPADVNENYTIEAMVWDSLNYVTPLTNRAVLNY